MLDCFPCFKKSGEDIDQNINNNNNVPVAHPISVGTPTPQPRGSQNYDANNVDDVDSSDIEARCFTFRELATATKNFRRECLLGECASGRIYKGTLPNNGEVVSVKRMDRIHGNKEFLVEVHMLSLLRHSNLLNLVGYCADGDQRLLVYEFMPMGSVEGHLFDLDAEKKSLDWATRMKIACGTAQGIEYLHAKAKPPVIYRDLKCSNIMLDDEFNPKLSDYGLAKLGASNMSHMTVMGSEGYSAPEYQKHGELTLKSDVYSFGVVLLELISGRRALDTSKPADEQHLVAWAQPIFRNPKRFPEMADPRLNNSYPVKSLNQVVGVAAMCLQDEPDVRPLISDVVASLGFLDTAPPEEPVPKTEMETLPDDHPAWPPESKARSSMESDHDETDHSEESSEASRSDDEESFDKNHYERKNDFMDEDSDPDLESESSGSSSDDEETNEQEKQNSIKYSSSFGCINSLEYEVASMSSSSSISDNESPHGRTNKKSNDHKFQGGNNSLRMKCKSTKTPKEERREGLTTGSRRSSRKRGSSLSWKGRNDMVTENENIGSYSRKSSNEGSDNGSVFEKNRSMSSNSTKSSNEETDNGPVFERNLSISSNSSQSSIGGSEDGSERSGHHKDNEGLEDELL